MSCYSTDCQSAHPSREGRVEGTASSSAGQRGRSLPSWHSWLLQEARDAGKHLVVPSLERLGGAGRGTPVSEERRPASLRTGGWTSRTAKNLGTPSLQSECPSPNLVLLWSCPKRSTQVKGTIEKEGHFPLQSLPFLRSSPQILSWQEMG